MMIKAETFDVIMTNLEEILSDYFVHIYAS